MTSATEELRRLLDERGVEWYEPTMKPNTTWFLDAFGINCRVKPWGDVLQVKRYRLTPEQAIAATLGRPTWRNSYDQQRYDRWYNSLFHGEPSSFKELVEDIIWTAHTVDLGPNGNECQGVDEGEVYTKRLIESWAKLAATLGNRTLTAEQVREAWCSNLKRDCLYDPPSPDWQAIADELNATLGGGECEVEYVNEWMGWHCKSCDTLWQGLPDQKPSFCMRCGKAVKQ